MTGAQGSLCFSAIFSASLACLSTFWCHPTTWGNKGIEWVLFHINYSLVAL